jgi:hypothetical protein
MHAKDPASWKHSLVEALLVLAATWPLKDWQTSGSACSNSAQQDWACICPAYLQLLLLLPVVLLLLLLVMVTSLLWTLGSCERQQCNISWPHCCLCGLLHSRLVGPGCCCSAADQVTTAAR